MTEKGFVYITEVVLISMILIVSLAFLVRPIIIDEDWGSVDLRRMTESALDSIDRKFGLEETVFNETSFLEDEVNSLFYQTGQKERVEYNLKVEDSYPRRVLVGFNCTGDGCLEGDPVKEYGALWEIFSRTWINGRFITFQMREVDFTEFEGDGSLADEIDVFVIRGKDQVEEANQNRDALKKFLDGGGGLVQFSNFTEVSDYDIQEEIFGLEDGGVGGDELEFTNREDPTNPNYEPSKLFYGVSGLVNTGQPGQPSPREGSWNIRDREYTVDVVEDGENVTISNETGHELCSMCVEGDSFTLDIDLDYKETKIRRIYIPEEGPYRKQTVVWLDYPEGYRFYSDDFNSSAESTEGPEFEVLGTDAPVLVVNYPHNGRAVWLSESKDSAIGEHMQDDIKSLFQASALWAAPRGFWVKERTKSPRRKSSQVTRFGFVNEDIYEPYSLTMEIWYAY